VVPSYSDLPDDVDDDDSKVPSKDDNDEVTEDDHYEG